MKQSDTADTMKWFQKTTKMTLVVYLLLVGLVSAESSNSEAKETTTEVEKTEEVKNTEETKEAEELKKPEEADKSKEVEKAEKTEEANGSEESEDSKESNITKKSEDSEESKKAEESEEGSEAVEMKKSGAGEQSDESEQSDEKSQPDKKPLTEKEAEAAEEAKSKERAKTGESIESQVLGWKEWVKIGTKADKMRAKLDSGARTSSLHAEGEEEFERDGRKWVRFSIRDPDKKDAKSILIKAPVQRVARVKNTDGTVERRYVVELGFTVGDRQLREEFTLNDRGGMICPVLIGRNALRHLGYVDCSRVDLADKKIVK